MAQTIDNAIGSGEISVTSDDTRIVSIQPVDRRKSDNLARARELLAEGYPLPNYGPGFNRQYEAQAILCLIIETMERRK